MEALTPAQQERISQNFRAAKALLARKRPLENATSAEKFVSWTLFLMFLKLIESCFFLFFGIVSHESMSVCGFLPPSILPFVLMFFNLIESIIFFFWIVLQKMKFLCGLFLGYFYFG